MKIKDVLYLIGTDLERFAEVRSLKLGFLKKISLILYPAIFCLILHRFAHFFFVNKHYIIARLFYTINFILFSADIAPSSSIGSHLYMPHIAGVVIVAKVGNHCTMYGRNGLGGGLKEFDIGAGPGLPIVEDNVVLGYGSAIIGPIVIGKGAKITPFSIVTKPVPAGAIVVSEHPRIVKRTLKSQV